MFGSRLRAGLGVVALAVVLGVVLLSYIRGDGPPGSIQAARDQCLAGYRRARSAADSAMVDAWTPVMSKGQAPVAQPCGLIRREGTLRASGRRTTRPVELHPNVRWSCQGHYGSGGCAAASYEVPWQLNFGR
jgi:hypothetical protein